MEPDQFDMGEMPPLENSVILEVLFKYCPPKTLKACRLVSKQWRDISQEAWKISAKVNLTSWDSVCQFVQFVEENGSNFPSSFTKYRLERKESMCGYHCQCSNRSGYEKDCERFWNRCGLFIRDLEIVNMDFKSLDNFRRIIYKSCPNLENLTLSNGCQIHDGYNDMDPTGEWRLSENHNLRSLTLRDTTLDIISWVEFFEHFPAIESISNEDEELWAAVRTIRHFDPTKLPLKAVNVIDWYQSEHPRSELKSVLLDSRLHLEKLSIDFSDDAEFCSNVLRVHSRSLKKLDLEWDFSHDFDRYFYNHDFKSLQELYLRTCPFSMEFLKFTPNLKKLRLNAGYIADAIRSTNMPKMESVSLTGCTSLRIFIADNLTLEDLKKLEEWIPKIENLSYRCVNNEGFEMLCRCWPDLVSLELDLCTVDDIGLTGFDVEDVKTINENAGNFTWRPITVPRANISAFKNLQRLEMFGWGTDTKTLGHCAAVHGIQELKKLRNLKTNDCYVLQGDKWSEIERLLDFSNGGLFCA